MSHFSGVTACDLTADLHLKVLLRWMIHLSEIYLANCGMLPSFAQAVGVAKNAGRSIQRARDCTERDLKESFLMRAAEQTEKLKTLIERWRRD